MKIEIEYIEIGRNKFSGKKTYDIKTVNLQESIESAEIEAYNEIQKHLLSSNVEMNPEEDEYSDKNSYVVFAGMHTVGKVIIRRIK